MSHYAFANDADDTPTLWRMPEGSGEPVAVMRRTENTEAFDLLMTTSANSDSFPWKCADCDETVCHCPLPSPMDEEQEREAEAHAEWMQEAALAQWDDDPNPYHGDYSEL